MLFYSFAIISLWGRGMSFNWTILNPLYLRIICTNFGWNWPSGFREEVENIKVQHTDGQTTDNGRSEKLTRASSSGELKRNKDDICTCKEITFILSTLKVTRYVCETQMPPYTAKSKTANFAPSHQQKEPINKRPKGLNDHLSTTIKGSTIW